MVADDARTIGWEGFHNARDLGGLPTADGRYTRRGAAIRSADLRFVTAAGWRAAYDAGVRTIVDLRNDDEINPTTKAGPTALAGSAQFVPDAAGPVVPEGMTRVHVPLDDVEDVEFWRYLNETRLNGTPLYYRPFLERKPERCAAAVRAVARARPGGVIFHCGAGRDRTGLLAMLLLTLVGVAPRVVADDYEVSTAGLAVLLAAMGEPDEAPRIARLLAERGTTTHAAVMAACDGLDTEAYLLAAGLTADDLRAARDRLLAEGSDRAPNP